MPSAVRRPATLLASLARWNDERLTRHALSRLSRHERSDIGIETDDVLSAR